MTGSIDATADRVVADDVLSAFYAEGEVRHGLPPMAYKGESFWARERAQLFPNHWTLVGFAHEISAVGDVKPVKVGDSPVLLVRNREKRIKAFHNVCRHRCLKLVDEPTNVGRLIKCPYHAWVYGLDGDLRSTPYFGGRDPKAVPPGFNPRDHGLMSVACEVWHDWVFVNLNANAQRFSDFTAPLEQQLESLDLSSIRLAGVIDLGVIACNWKFLVENFIEPYHVQFVHGKTTDQPLTSHFIIDEGHCLGSGVDLSESIEGGESSDNTLAVSARYLALFPNFLLGRYYPNQLGVHLNVPLGPNRTLQRRAIYTTDGVELDANAVEKLKQLWTAVHREDHEICIRLQKGRESSAAFDGGLLSPHWESGVRRFQEQVIAATGTSGYAVTILE